MASKKKVDVKNRRLRELDRGWQIDARGRHFASFCHWSVHYQCTRERWEREERRWLGSKVKGESSVKKGDVEMEGIGIK